MLSTKEIINIIVEFFEASPYTIEGKQLLVNIINKLPGCDLSPEELYKQIQTAPYFLAELAQKPESRDDMNRYDNFNYYYDRKKENIEKLKDAKKYFENNIKKEKTHPLMILLGCAGSGKSTYIGNLLHDSQESAIVVTRFDFDRAIDTSLSFFGEEFNEIDPTAKGRFELLLLGKIKDSLEEIIFNKHCVVSITKYFNEVLKMISVEGGAKRDNPNIPLWISDIFCFFEYYCNDNEYSEDNLRSVLKDSIYKVREQDRPDKLANIIKDWMKLISIMSLCNKATQNQRHIFLFDGIEHLIGAKLHIYDPSIEFILKTIHDFCEHHQGSDNSIFKNVIKFSEKFIFILCVRDTTKRYINDFNNMQLLNRQEKRTLDITKWFLFYDVYKKRIGILEKYLGKNSHFVALKDFIDIIMNDTEALKPGHSLMEMLEPMYNNDKRSIAFHFFKSLERIYSNSGKGFIESFKIYWNKFNDNEKIHPYRYLCRRAIIRLMFNNIRFENKENNIIDKLFHCSESGTPRTMTTCARKIFAYLSNAQCDRNDVNDLYLDFNTLKIKVLKSRCGGIDLKSAEFEVFTRMLFYMGNYDMPLYKWHQLITIKYNDQEISTARLELNEFQRKMKILATNPEKNLDYGFKINYAGIFTAYFQADFEFFACRYLGDAPPLIFLKDAEIICRTIEIVYEKSVACMKTILIDEYKTFEDYEEMKNCGYLYRDGKGREIPHPVRIIRNHITYLEHYEVFVKENMQTEKKNKINFIFSLEIGRKILKCILQNTDNYRIALMSLLKGYAPPNTAFAADENDNPHLCGRPINNLEPRPYLFAFHSVHNLFNFDSVEFKKLENLFPRAC